MPLWGVWENLRGKNPTRRHVHKDSLAVFSTREYLEHLDAEVCLADIRINRCQDTEERSVAVAVRIHRTLELADDKYYMITCGKAILLQLLQLLLLLLFINNLYAFILRRASRTSTTRPAWSPCSCSGRAARCSRWCMGGSTCSGGHIIIIIIINFINIIIILLNTLLSGPTSRAMTAASG